MRASYSASLFVQSNSNLHAINVLLPFLSIKRKPTPSPSHDLDPSNYKDQNSLSTNLFTVFTLIIV
jgi:hypothetical protein